MKEKSCYTITVKLSFEILTMHPIYFVFELDGQIGCKQHRDKVFDPLPIGFTWRFLF